MLIGAHVSPAGGPAKAIERGVEKGCDAIQIFNQNPRAWKPTVYSDEQVADFRAAMDSSRVDALLIHAVYLLNAASDEKEFRDKTRASLIASLQAGDALGAHAVVLHPGSAKTGKVAPAIKRAGKVIAQAPGQRDLRSVGPVPVRPVRLEHARQVLEPRLGEEDAAAAAAELALADVGVAVAV